MASAERKQKQKTKPQGQKSVKPANGTLKEHVNEVLKRIGDEQGLADLCLDENNHCMLLFDERIVLNMDLDEAGKLLVVYAYIGDVPRECREAIWQKALEGNFFWKETEGSTLGLDKQSQSLVSARAFALPLTDIAAFGDCLGVFVEVVEKWMARIERFVKEHDEQISRSESRSKRATGKF